ncbi:MAG: S46 family peptidase [Bacteroidetes bacterium]|nr:S46 family peptidase [Bacteroidota bacterium]MCW5894561.1 S46 family peptidase [Bacteroidota bacterium]
MNKRALVLAILFSFSALQVNADEGMWLLDSISKLPMDGMKRAGLELTPEQIFSNTHPSVKDAIVLLPGGTGGFVSAEGLIVTNHHIAFAGIQELSSVSDDYLKNGFLAASRDKELSTSYTAEIVQTITDVTAEVFSATTDQMSEDERDRAIRSKRKEIEDRMQDSTNLACRVTDMYGGVKYYLFTSLQLKDVRLVYAPPEAIGVFGGETDNWTWPRHTGDFAFMRAYTGPDGKPAKYSESNIPYTPRKFLPISLDGVPEGSFAMIMGFPGRTFRYREASSIQLSQEVALPLTNELFTLRTGIIERWGHRDRAIAIKYASKHRRLANTQKNSVGTLEGLKRTGLVATKKAEESQLAAYISSDTEAAKKYGNLLADLKAANDELRSSAVKNVFSNNVNTGVELFMIAARFGTYVNSLKKDDAGNMRDAEEKDRQPVRDFLGGLFKDFDVNVDKEMLSTMILKNAELPENQQVKAFAEIYGRRTGNDRERKVREFVDELYDDTRLAKQEDAEKLLMRKPSAILGDDAIVFYRKYAAEASAVSSVYQSVLRKINSLRTKYVEAWLEWKNTDVTYPDANRTIRFTYGTVQPLAPRDAVLYSTVTTLAGVMEKESDTNEEFHVPAKLKELWHKKDFGRYADPKLNDVPVAFISDLDITGGNSGSPVINGKGELIGCAFDGNWEGVVGDYIFEDRLNRCISVDSRYMLFVLDKFSGGEHILKELVIRQAGATSSL